MRSQTRTVLSRSCLMTEHLQPGRLGCLPRHLLQSLNMMELSSLLAGAGLLPKRSGGSMNKSQLVRMLQQALGQEDGLQVQFPLLRPVQL